MYTENFYLNGPTGTWTRQGLVRTIRYDEGNAGGVTPMIRITSTSGSKCDVQLRPGRTLTLNEPISGIVIRNDAGSAYISGKITFGDGSVQDNSIVGEVSTIDGEKARTLAGGMFGGTAVCGNGGANYSNSQIWNPAASGKNLIITSASSGLYGGAGAANYWMSTTQLNTAAVNPPSNKRGGGAVPVALLRQQLSAAELAQLSPILRNETLPSTTSVTWNIRGAIVVPPGYGLISSAAVATLSLNASFEWFEEPQ